MRLSFTAIIKTHHGNLGTDSRIVVRYGLSPAAQRTLFEKAIVGYDVHHPDSPGYEGLKFYVPAKKEPEVKEKEKTDGKETFFNSNEHYAG